MVSENVEEYLEAIYRLLERGERLTTINIAKELGISPSSVSEMLRKLDKRGYLHYQPYKAVTLGRRGRRLGRSVLRKHRLLERFLSRMGVSKHRVHHEACRLEHAVSGELEKAIDKELGERIYTKGIVTLCDLRTGQVGEVVFIETGLHVKRRLEDMGLTPGTKIRVLRTALFGGPVEIAVRGSRLALGKYMARRIFVRVRQ
jgi:DtxR family Mn-dependent transcriptional regulator